MTDTNYNEGNGPDDARKAVFDALLKREAADEEQSD
jgi:hypothetical protein